MFKSSPSQVFYKQMLPFKSILRNGVLTISDFFGNIHVVEGIVVMDEKRHYRRHSPLEFLKISRTDVVNTCQNTFLQSENSCFENLGGFSVTAYWSNCSVFTTTFLCY